MANDRTVLLDIGPVLLTDGCPGCKHGESDGHATHRLMAPSCMTYFADLDEKKALNLRATRADEFIEST
jgi:hypothetical protein